MLSIDPEREAAGRTIATMLVAKEIRQGGRIHLETILNEIGALAARFNDMTQSLRDARAETRRGVEERLALEAHLRDTSQLATLGQLAAEIAHEVGTPLGSVSGHLHLALVSPDLPSPVRDRLVIATQEIARVGRIIRDYLDSTRRLEPDISDVDVERTIRDAVFTQVMLSAGDIAGHAGGPAAAIREVNESGLRVTAFQSLRDF